MPAGISSTAVKWETSAWLLEVMPHTASSSSQNYDSLTKVNVNLKIGLITFLL